MKQFLSRMYATAAHHNRRNILDALPVGAGSILDVGCDDGAWTRTLAERAGCVRIAGIEIVAPRAAEARTRGIEVMEADLNDPWPYDNASFDVVHANQVIEHVPSIDHFMAELHRVIRPGGTAVVSTENASSWCNVAAAAMGWQIFSLTNVSARRSGIGNPFALHREDAPEYSSWTHKVIFSYRGLQELFNLFGFQKTRILGAGYFPLPTVLGRIDPRHSHFITIQATRD